MIDFDALLWGKSSVSKANVLPSVLEDDFDEEPVEVGNFDLGDFELVGHGEVTNENCGRFSGYFYGCLRVDLHKLITLDGVNYAGKVYAKPYFHSCDKPSCPVCFKYGWVVREARSIVARLEVASKRFGLVEHVVCSVPTKDYGLSFNAMRLKAVKVLKSRGIVGGVLVFHAFRFNLEKWWYFSPHWHVLCFVLGGYAKCRNCKRKWNCLEGCGGFDDRAWQAFQKDGWYVKVLGKRKSVFRTAAYQLNHSSVKKGAVRFHVASWFGNCSYRKLKVTAEMRKSVCPISKHDLEKLRYNGSLLDIWMLAYGGGFYFNFREESDWKILAEEEVWQVEQAKYQYGSGNYE